MAHVKCCAWLPAGEVIFTDCVAVSMLLSRLQSRWTISIAELIVGWLLTRTAVDLPFSKVQEKELEGGVGLQDLNAGGIQCISFSLLPASLNVKAFDRDEPTAIPDFTVSTDQGSILAVSAASFHELRARWGPAVEH